MYACRWCSCLSLSQMLAAPKDHVPQLTMLFERLVETTLGVTKEEMSQPVFAGLGCLTYPELHDVRYSSLPYKEKCFALLLVMMMV